MRCFFVVAWLGWLCLALAGCGAEPDGTPEVEPTPIVLATASAPLAPSVEVVATLASVTLTVWAPLEFTPSGEEAGAALLQQQIGVFEATYPDTRIVYEPKPLDGPASLLNFLRSASAVAPSVLPDMVIIPVTELEEVAQTGLLFPLNGLVDEALADDLYPFATRDTRIAGEWLALPLAVQAEHGATRAGRRAQVPRRLQELSAVSAPLWLFAGQGVAEGEMSDALLLQLLALDGTLPGPEALPAREPFVALLEAFQEAEASGSVPGQVLSTDENAPLLERVQQGRAHFIQTNSRQYLAETEQSESITFAPLPTLAGAQVTVLDGYLIALVTEEPRQQEAAVRYLTWLFEPANLAQWGQTTHWLPARQSALPAGVEEAAYAAFLDERLRNGWLRPSGSAWGEWAQAVQEQFRAVLLGQTTPAEAVRVLEQADAP